MPANLFEAVQRVFLLIVVVISFFIVISYVLSMGLGILILFSTSDGLVFSRGSISLNPLLIADVEITVNAGIYFLILWWVFALCFVAAWKYREGLVHRIQDFFSGASEGNPFTNNLLAMPMITSMMFVATIILHTLQSQAGVPTGEPPISDSFLDFIMVSRAPIVEEVIFRIVPIGAFLVTYISVVGGRMRHMLSLRGRLRMFFLSIVQPDKAKGQLGLKTIGENGFFGGGMTWGEWIMVFFTGVLFGLAHYYGSWGPGKISQAALNGVIFALAYLYYGVQAPILLHWFFNYYFTVFDLSSTYYLTGIDIAYSSFLANFFLGILAWTMLIVLCLVMVVRKLRTGLAVSSAP
jgi:hypothetical protein